MNGDAEGEIITFYSFKGGTGRSMALANAAWILASNGKRVLAVDWDLESPGLHRYFHPFLVDRNLQNSRGVIDLIWDFSAATMDLDHGDDPAWLTELTRIERYAVSLDWGFPDEGIMDFVPTGRQDSAYSKRVSTIDWNTLYERQGGGEFFAQLRADMKRSYDYILIDSRTGLSDSAGICTLALPDTVVDCFTMSAQSIDGACATAISIRDRGRRPLRILPLPMRIEDAELGKLEAGRDYVRRIFEPFLSHLDHNERERYWGEVEVPYKPFYAYEEILATIGDRPMQETSLLASYERLVAVLTGGQVTRLEPMDEADRRRWLEEFERTRQAAPSDIFVSHVEQDRMWADWIAYQLGAAGYRVVRQGASFPPGTDLATELERAIANTSCTLAVMSPDYLESQSARITWGAALSRDRTGGQGLLVPVQVAKFRPWGRFANRIPVDLDGLRETEAAEELLAAVRNPGLTPSEPGPDRTSLGDPPRFPGAQPLVSNLPQRNAHFVGRDALLLKLRHRLLSSTTAVVVPQALHGLGGVGKTQVALEYAHRFAADYDVVWWVAAEQSAEARVNLAALAPLLRAHTDGTDGTDDTDYGDTAQLVRAALDALRRGEPYRRWLIVFDNAEAPEELEPLLPTGPGHVLITSRNQGWAREAETVEIDVFSREESIELLQRRGRDISKEDSDQLAERLGDLPLALEQAAVWQAETGMPVEEYLQLFDERLSQLLERGRPQQYPTSVAATWSIAFDRLRTDAPASVQLLELCAFFGPEPIPFRLLNFGHLASLPEPLAATISDSIQRRRAVREIGRYALAKIDPGHDTLQVHRLVQAVLRAGLDGQQQAGYLNSVHQLMALANPGSPDLRRNWSQHAELSPHIVPTGVVEGTHTTMRKVVLDQVRYRYRRGDINSSRELAEYARVRWMNLLGPDDEQNLVVSRYLADSLRWLGEYERARSINEDTISRLERILGPEHEHTMATWNSIGGDLRVLGHFAEAKVLDEENLVRHRRVYGEDAPETLRSSHNLAVDLRLLGEFQAAFDLDEETLRRRRRVLDPDDSYILSTTANLARDTMRLGDFAGAVTILENTLTAFRKVLPSDHVEILSAARAHSAALRMAGDYASARHASEENLLLHHDRFGPDHQLTFDTMITVGNNRRAAGDLTGAEAVFDETLARSESTLGSEHPFTQAAAINFGVVLRALGWQQRAEELTSRALAVFLRRLGEDHFFTVAAMANRASDHAAAGEHEQARQLSEQAAEISRRTRGENHPDTLCHLFNLSIDQRAAGDPRAQRVQEDTVSRLRRVLGENHPVAVAAAGGHRAVFDIETPPT
jgi:tetratricopeptide (TPR) repeat protein